MNESLIPERPIVVSPSLAATIGLEEAILLQHIETLQALAQTEHKKGYQWTRTNLATLSSQLPFWSPPALRRILHKLIDLGMILIDSFPNAETQTIELAINQQTPLPPLQTPLQNNPQGRQSPLPASGLGATRIPPNWQPDHSVISQLSQQGVDLVFIEASAAEFVLYWRERDEASHAWSSKFIQHVSRRWQTEQNYRSEQAARQNTISQASTEIEKQWQPSLDAIEILVRMGINKNFIDDAVAEFILYWQERKEAQTTWNSKFVNHVKRQWARFTHTLKHDTEPVAISDNWIPDHEVFDVLTIANIDAQFARDLIGEFVLYWRDNNQLHHSWNTKFLQHVKYRWARRNTNDSQSRGDAFERLTDRSWAADLV